MGKSELLKKAVNSLDDAVKIGHDVAEVTPNTTSTATKKSIYTFAGGKGEIISQVSSFMANYEYSQSIFGLNPPDFEKWCDEFEEGFQKAPIKDRNRIFGDITKPWGKDRENRPKIKILNEEGNDANKYAWCEFYPDWDNKNEVYFVCGTPYMCAQQIMQIWNQKQALESGDFAQILGLPPSEWIKKRPTIGLSVQFVLWDRKSPRAWQLEPGGIPKKNPKRVQISIPFAKRSALNYGTIRSTLGGESGMKWGKYYCQALVADDVSNYPQNNKGMPKIVARGSSAGQAKQNLKSLLQFTDAKVVSMHQSNPETGEDLNPTNDTNESFSVYPIYMFVLNSRILNFTSRQGRETRLGKLDTKANRIELYYKTKPHDFDEKLDQLFRW